MEISRPDEKTVVIRRIDAFSAALLRQIPIMADPGEDPAVQGRFFSNPADESEAKLNEEWKTYVEPELRHLFQSANETVAADLSGIAKETEDGDGSLSLTIPVKHLDQWLNSLNQARLALAARNGFTEADLDAETPRLINSPRELCLLQIHFYGFLQEVFVREIG